MSNIIDTAEYARQTIDEVHGATFIGGMEFAASRILEELDPIAFRQVELDVIDANVEGGLWAEDENGDIVEAE